MARPKKPVDELKDQRVPIMMSEDELKLIDDWRFENRIASRGEAIRRLCQIGILFSGEALRVSDLAFAVTEHFSDFLKAEREGGRQENNLEMRADAFMRYYHFFDVVTDLVARAEAFRTHESVEAATEESNMIASFKKELAPWLKDKE